MPAPDAVQSICGEPCKSDEKGEFFMLTEACKGYVERHQELIWPEIAGEEEVAPAPTEPTAPIAPVVEPATETPVAPAPTEPTA